MARRKGSLNKIPAKTGKRRIVCEACKKKKYIDCFPKIKGRIFYFWDKICTTCDDEAKKIFNDLGNAGTQPKAKTAAVQIITN